MEKKEKKNKKIFLKKEESNFSNLNEKEQSLKEDFDKLEVLSEIYNDLANKVYSSKEDAELAKLKMELTKKEMLLLNFMINKKIEMI